MCIGVSCKLHLKKGPGALFKIQVLFLEPGHRQNYYIWISVFQGRVP